MHAADKNTNCVQHHTHTQHTWTRERAAERTRAARSHNETEHGARVSEPRHETETQDLSARIRTPRSNTKQGTQTRAGQKTRKQDKKGVSELCHKTTNKLDRSDRTLTLPPPQRDATWRP